MSTLRTTYPVQPANGGSVPDYEPVETASNAGETPRSFEARHLDEWERRQKTKPFWIPSPSAVIQPVRHEATIGGVEHAIQVWHKHGELADHYAVRSVRTVARWSLANPADV